MEKLHKTKNKIRVYSYDMPHLHGFLLSLTLRAGELYEDIPGITHLLEHVVCQGLDNIFQNSASRELDKYGLYFDGSTDDNFMRFEIEGNAKFFREACRIFVTLLDAELVTADALKLEKDRICREIDENYMPANIRELAKGLVWEDTPLVREATVESMRGITLSQLKSEWKKVFTANNMFFYVTGAIPPSDLDYFYSLIEGYRVARGAEERKNLIVPPARFLNRDVQVYSMPSSFNAVALNFDYNPKKYEPHEIRFLFRMLFLGGNSVFYRVMSWEKGLIYGSGEDNNGFDNVGNITYNYEVASENLLESIQAIVGILRGLKTEIPSLDFERVQTYYTENTHYVIDDVDSLNYGVSIDNHIEAYGYTDYADLVARFSTITPERLRGIAAEIFTPQNASVVIKWEKKPDVKKIRSIISKI